MQLHADDNFIPEFSEPHDTNQPLSTKDAVILAEALVKLHKGELEIHTKNPFYFLSHHVFERRISAERYVVLILIVQQRLTFVT